MAAYQVPQFLDSGDKILGPLNVRQFGYALGGFFVVVITYSIIQRAIPASGIYAFVPAVPPGLFSAYLALGKYNGRDADVYAYKFILYLLKPRFMSYRRLPYIDDLNAKLAEWSYTSILARWQTDQISQQDKHKNVESFRLLDSEEKADKIRNLGRLQDTTLINTLSKVQQIEGVKLQKQSLLPPVYPPNGRRPLPTFSPNTQFSNPNQPAPYTPAPAKLQETNFFNAKKSSENTDVN